MKSTKLELLPSLVSIILLATIGMGPLAAISAPDQTLFEARIRIIGEMDQSYSGRYAADPRLQAMLDGLSEVKRLGLERVANRTGLFFDDFDKFIVRFIDTGPASDLGASIQPALLDGERVSLVDLSADQFVLGVMDVNASLVHEFIHGVMRELMGSRRYYALPRRIREGVAVWGAGQLRERCNNLVATAFIDGKDQEKLLGEIGRTTGPVDDYLMDALLFEYIDTNHGQAAVKMLLADIMAGEDWDVALQRATGFSTGQLHERQRRFAHMYLEGVVFESGLGIFADARKRLAAGDPRGAIGRLADLAEGPFDTLLKPSAWYWLGRLYYEREEFGMAAEAFAIVVEFFPDQRGVCDASREWLSEATARLDARERELLALGKPLIPVSASILFY